MKRLVSRERAKKTRTREKKAVRVSLGKAPLGENPLIAMFLAVLLWGATVVTIGFGDIVTARPDTAAILPLAGMSIFLLVYLFATGLFLQVTKSGMLRQNSKILLLALISLLSIVAGKGLLYFAQQTTMIPLEIAQFLMPFAMAPLLCTILMDGAAGIAAGTWTALALAMMTSATVDRALPDNAPSALPLFVAGLVATMIAAHTAPRVRTRGRIFRIGVIIAVSQASCVLGMTALNWQHSHHPMLLVHQAVACLVGGVLSALIVMLILPLIETVFHITTDITLLELSDLGHPLLQRLAIEAPGTYHHSLVVASLAQAAADEIGANSLLARVAAYFHDVGKLTKPNFFAENIQLQTNPHDDLAPSMSTLVITAHVKEGLSLALLHKLPEPITSVIREHHGTSLIHYFHHKAMEQLELELAQQNGQANGTGRLDEGAFRYPGPKPSSRESAIICLADAVEAASRSMEKPTPSNIEGLISDIMSARLKDGQLDACDLTLIQLARIKRSFAFTLTNMLHGRMPYPKDEDRDKQQATPSQSEQAESRPSDTAPDGTRRQAAKE